MTSERYYNTAYNGRVSGYRAENPPRRRAGGLRAMPMAQQGRSARTENGAGAPSYARRPQGGRPGQYRPGKPGPQKPKRRWRVPAKLRFAIFLLAVLVVAFGVVKLVGNVKASTEERFVDNVFINGVSLTGYTRDEGYKVIYNLRDTWLNTTYSLTFQDRKWSFTPASVNANIEFDTELERAWNLGHVGDRSTRKQIIKGLKQVPAEFTSEPTYDESALDSFIADIAESIDTEPIDAEVTLTSLKPVITRASVNGWELDQEQLKQNLIEIIETGTGETALPVREVTPTVASDNLEMKVIAKCETDVTFRGYNSRTNVRLALEHFNLMTVYPGDTISFNEVVGPRTEALGYLEAPEYAGSNKEMGFGGGVCQASTTLYNAVIQAGMTIIQRSNHSMTVTYIEPSLDAAVAYGSKDFVFRNDTEHAIYIYTNVTKELASVTIYGTRPEYHYVLESVILKEEESTKTGYENDEEGKYVYYTSDPPVLYKEGRGSCESEGWIVSYDWQTKQEVSRVMVNHDVYSAGVNVYWRGVHKRSAEEPGV